MDKLNTKDLIYADLITDFLKRKGIKHVFDLSGGMIAYIEDSISRTEGIECVPMHHEQSAGFAAEGYARVSGNFGVALATSGPGATNLVTAISSAFFDSTPTMFLVGYVNTENIKKNQSIRQDGFQETDIVSVVKPVTKYATLIKSAEELLPELNKAYEIMKSGRTGPVVLAIPIDIQRTIQSLGYGAEVRHSKESLPKIEMSSVIDFQKLLEESNAPIVLLGHGIRLSKTIFQCKDFLKRNSLPVVQSLLGLDVASTDEQTLGYIGVNGNRVANIALARADLIIVLGSRLDVRQTGDTKLFNKKAKIIHVDIESVIFDYRIKSHLHIHADLNTFFEATKDICVSKKEAWLHALSEIKKRFERPRVYADLSTGDSPTVDPNTFVYELSNAAPANTIMVADVGQNQMWAAQSWQLKEGQRLLFSGGLGAMGFALPVCIGAHFASPNSKIIGICGDGGFQISLQELETVARNKIPIKFFVFNNNALGMVKEFQDLYLDQRYQSTVIGYGTPRLDLLAPAFGITYKRISRIDRGDADLIKVLESNESMLIEVAVDRKASLTPRVVYGHALDDQLPSLSTEEKKWLEEIINTVY